MPIERVDRPGESQEATGGRKKSLEGLKPVEIEAKQFDKEGSFLVIKT